MSNEYKDWKRDGGPCTDCIHNKFDGSDSHCAMKQESHKESICSKYDTNQSFFDALDALYRVGYESAGKTDYDPREAEEWQVLRTRMDNLKRALKIASRWGIRADGYSAEVSMNIREWVDAGMIGPPPEPPEYYPKMEETP